MTGIPMIALFIFVFVLVDDWYQTAGKHYLQGKPGVTPDFTSDELWKLPNLRRAARV